MTETIYVRGEGGAILAMDLPLPEGIAERYERGLITRVHSDGTPFAPVPTEAEPGDPGDGATPVGPDGRPPLNASKAEWIAYVITRGELSAEDAANYTKADLIDMVS